MSSSASPRFDIFLSHATPDKAWVRILCEHLTSLGVSVYFDERELKPGDNFVLDLADDGLRNSRFLVIVLTEHTADRPRVQWEYTTFMALNGPVERLISVVLEGAAVPAALLAAQGIKATRENEEAERVARLIVERVGVAADLKPDDSRRLTIGQNLAFLLEPAGENVRITDAQFRGHSAYGGSRRLLARTWISQCREVCRICRGTAARTGPPRLRNDILASRTATTATSSCCPCTSPTCTSGSSISRSSRASRTAPTRKSSK